MSSSLQTSKDIFKFLPQNSMGKNAAIEATLRDFVACPRFDEAVVRGQDSTWPRITIVTPSYNQGRYLEQTILSVLNQNYPNIEYIILDGGSSDNSLEIIRKYEKYITQWESKPDGGQAAAIDEGFRSASGEILAYLNSDDLYLPGALMRVGGFFNQNRKADFLYGDCLVIDGENSVIRRLYPIEFNRDNFLFENHIIPQQAAFWRRDAYFEVGGINTKLRYCMDYELWTKFMLAGVAFIRAKDVLAGFRWHAHSKTSHLRKVHDQEYREIVGTVIGRPLCQRDYLRISYLRLRRYYQEPRALLEGLKTRLRRLS